MRIEIFSDIACPWCFIGKRRLERALADAHAEAEAELVFRAFQLQPGLPIEGVPAAEFFERKFGGKERVRALFERLVEVGRADGIAFDFSAQRRAPNTELAQRVIRWASACGLGARTVEALFSGYFELGIDVGNLSDLALLLERKGVGLDESQLIDAMSSGYGKDEVAADLRTARDYGIASVPMFVFERRYVVEGAQPVEHFTRLIAKLRAEDAPHLRVQSPARVAGRT